jgi:hypothetical protein
VAITPKKISVQTEVKDCKFIENRDLIVNAIEVYDGKKVTVTIERFYNKRSNKQNNYYWGVIVGHWKNIIRQEWGEIWTMNDVHDFLKGNLNFDMVVDTETGEIAVNPITQTVIRKPKSTTKNTTFTQEEYHKACRDLAFEMYGYMIPEPNEDLDQPIDVEY